MNQFTYTADFGNGVVGTISAQDPTAYYQAGVFNLGASAIGAARHRRPLAPATTAERLLPISSACCRSIRLGVCSRRRSPRMTTMLRTTARYRTRRGHPDDKWGWAGQLALSIKNIPTGAGDTINVQGVYTDGATRYNIQDLAARQVLHDLWRHQPAWSLPERRLRHCS